MELKDQVKRRDFFKYLGLSAASIALFKMKNARTILGISQAYAQAGKKDGAIKLQDYISVSSEMDTPAPMNNTGKPSGGKAKWETHKKDPKLAKGELPACVSCKFYKDPKDGYGSCAMVQATAKAPDKWVSEKGWCKLWSHK